MFSKLPLTYQYVSFRGYGKGQERTDLHTCKHYVCRSKMYQFCRIEFENKNQLLFSLDLLSVFWKFFKHWKWMKKLHIFLWFSSTCILVESAQLDDIWSPCIQSIACSPPRPCPKCDGKMVARACFCSVTFYLWLPASKLIPCDSRSYLNHCWLFPT